MVLLSGVFVAGVETGDHLDGRAARKWSDLTSRLYSVQIPPSRTRQVIVAVAYLT